MSMSCQGMMFANNTNEIVQVNELHEDFICNNRSICSCYIKDHSFKMINTLKA